MSRRSFASMTYPVHNVVIYTTWGHFICTQWELQLHQDIFKQELEFSKRAQDDGLLFLLVDVAQEENLLRECVKDGVLVIRCFGLSCHVEDSRYHITGADPFDDSVLIKVTWEPGSSHITRSSYTRK